MARESLPPSLPLSSPEPNSDNDDGFENQNPGDDGENTNMEEDNGEYGNEDKAETSPVKNSKNNTEADNSLSDESGGEMGNPCNAASIINLQTLSQEEFAELKNTNPLAALKLVMKRKNSSSNQAPDTSASVRSELLVETREEFLYKLQIRF